MTTQVALAAATGVFCVASWIALALIVRVAARASAVLERAQRLRDESAALRDEVVAGLPSDERSPWR